MPSFSLRRATPVATLPALALALSMLAGCSADAVEAPEPSVETPGAIVAMDTEGQGILLMQTQGVTGIGQGDPILFVDLYQVTPGSFAEARELARDPNLKVRTKDYFITVLTVVSSPHEVVWFRSPAP